MNNFTTATDTSFDAEVLKCDVTVVTLFWAEWSPASKQTEPYLQQLVKEYGHHIKIVTIDLQQSPLTVSEYEILTIPTLIVFKNGLIVERIVGNKPQAELVAIITPYLPTEL